MDFCLGLELTYHLQLDHAQDENPPCSFNEIYYISLSCLVVQSKLPVSCWLENETQCCLQLRSSVFDVHTGNVIGALVKCILQPTKDKTVTGKLSCLCLRWWCVVSLKITHLTATIIILFYFFYNATQISLRRAGVVSLRRHFVTVWKSELRPGARARFVFPNYAVNKIGSYSWMKCRTPNLCLTVVSLPCCCRRELNAHTLIFRTHYMWFCMCVCLLWNQLNIKSEKSIYPVVPQLVYANQAVGLLLEGRDPGAGRLTWMGTDHFWVCVVSWLTHQRSFKGGGWGRQDAPLGCGVLWALAKCWFHG